MTNLKKLTQSLNLQVLNSDETTNLKGGMGMIAIEDNALGASFTPPPVKPIGGGNPPDLNSLTQSFV